MVRHFSTFFVLCVLFCSFVFAEIQHEILYATMPVNPLMLLINPEKDLAHCISGYPTGGEWTGNIKYNDFCGTRSLKFDGSTSIFFCMAGNQFMPADDQRHGLSIFAYCNIAFNGELQTIISGYDINDNDIFKLWVDYDKYGYPYLNFSVYDITTNSYARARTKTTMWLGWNLIGFNWNGDLGNRTFLDYGCSFYRNGGIVATDTKTDENFYSANTYYGDLYIGCGLKNGQRTDYFTGDILAIGITNSVIQQGTASEGKRLFYFFDGKCQSR
jgi:hypothetical protein